MNFTIRPPRRSEWPVCRMLLPDAFKASGNPEFRLAVQEGAPRIVGAVSFRRGAEVMHSVMVHILPTHRRRGIGMALLQDLFRESHREGFRELAALVDLTAHPTAKAFLLSGGFVHQAILHTVEGDMADAAEKILSLRDRMAASGRIPAFARIAPVDESNREAALRLYADYIACNRHDLHVPSMKLAPGDFVHSRVLTVEGCVQGMLLGSVEDGIARIAALVVSPPYRHGWATILLLSVCLESARSAGARSIRFDFLDSNVVMRNFHLKKGTVRMLASFVHPLL